MPRVEERLSSVPKRYWFALFFVALAILSTPTPGPDWFTPETPATFVFALGFTLSKVEKVVETVILSNNTAIITTTTTTVKTSSYLGRGFVTLRGKGGLSADPPLRMSVTLYFHGDAYAELVALLGEPRIEFTPIGAFATEDSPIPFVPIVSKKDNQGFPIAASIPLAKYGDKWTGERTVIYNQGGLMPANLTVGNWTVQTTSAIEIDSAAVTVTARTNSLLVSLTWVIIALAAVEIRYEKKEQKSKDEEEYHC